jgi:hypothetical protein
MFDSGVILADETPAFHPGSLGSPRLGTENKSTPASAAARRAIGRVIDRACCVVGMVVSGFGGKRGSEVRSIGTVAPALAGF